MLVEHYDATKARLAAAAELNDKTYGSIRSAKDAGVKSNFMVFSLALFAYADGRRLTAADTYNGDVGIDFEAQAVAVDADGVYVLIDAVRKQMIGHRLTVAGRSLTAFGDEDLDYPDIDRTTGLITQTLHLSAISSRA